MKKIFFTLVVISFLFNSGCTNDTTTVTVKSEINDFVWKGMNSWYNWQTNVPNLSDSKDDFVADYTSFLNGYSKPEELFDALLYDYPNTDRFSWIVDDYIALNNAFQGISISFGMRLQAVIINENEDIIFYVRYVAPDSPASNAGIVRGDIINALDGIILNNSNYSSTVDKLDNETVTFSFVSADNGALTPLGDKTITAIELSENPVHYQKVFDNIGGRKVGYLVYNGFRSSYNDELNDAFAYFQSEGINELILDLRLNGGGSVLTSAYLASMVYANAGTQVFAQLNFNDKHSNENGNYDFENTLNIYDVNGNKTGSEPVVRLNSIDRLYVLASGSTASASEMIINGLKAFIPVKVIGTTTYGKNVGSITLYDSPSSDFTSESSADDSHLYAMQPIVFQIFNKLGQSDYTQGFDPDIEVKEWQFWDNILPFGDENEVVLKAALDDIRGISAKSFPTASFKNMKPLDVKQLENKFEKEMYLEKDHFEQQ